jgi:hypothetical protein
MHALHATSPLKVDSRMWWLLAWANNLSITNVIRLHVNPYQTRRVACVYLLATNTFAHKNIPSIDEDDSADAHVSHRCNTYCLTVLQIP